MINCTSKRKKTRSTGRFFPVSHAAGRVSCLCFPWQLHADPGFESHRDRLPTDLDFLDKPENIVVGAFRHSAVRVSRPCEPEEKIRNTSAGSFLFLVKSCCFADN